MAEVSVSPEALKAPAWQLRRAVAAVLSMLDRPGDDFVSVVRVESIAYNAEVLHVSMAARIMPVLTNVQMTARVA